MQERRDEKAQRYTVRTMSNHCIHEFPVEQCGICGPRPGGIDVHVPARNSRLFRDRGTAKQESVDVLCRLMDLEPMRLGVGSSIPSGLFDSMARRFGVQPGSMPEIGEALAKQAGVGWDGSCDSRSSISRGGSTVRAIGLERLVEAVRKLTRPAERRPLSPSGEEPHRGNPREDGRVPEEMPRGEDVEERLAVELAVAAGLAELSAVEVTPAEVDVRSQFDSDAVVFTGGAWLDYVIRVQDWLRVALDAEGELSTLATQLFEGIGVQDVSATFAVDGDQIMITNIGLDLLRDRVDRAVDLKDKFIESLDAGSPDAASAAWIEAWDDTVEETVSGPIMAKAGIWSIHDFASRAKTGRLELSPSYQRGDVWPTKDAQLLIESILRGIPLPSVIILRPMRDGAAPFEVVDGKQRLTAMLRFMGAHPKAIELVKEKSAQFPDFELDELFRTDYSRFRKAWKNATGETLSSTKEREYYFPFKVSSTSQALQGDLAPLVGKYYHAIRDRKVRVGGEGVDVQKIFESTTDYKIPVIDYTEATPRQIHEVFSLYNKQGKHLNAEEIRNAVYHELDLMRALSVAAGDNPDLEGVAAFLLPVRDAVRRIESSLNEYRIGDARYRRTKVLSWLVSLLFTDPLGDDGRPRLLSTAQQINGLLDRVQNFPGDPFRDQGTIRDALSLASVTMEAHSAADAWADDFKNNARGARWQELQLVASLLGVSMATVVLGSDVADGVIDQEASLRRRSRTEWGRPKKTQTGKQWEYIACVALAILDELGIAPSDVDTSLRSRYGFSCVPALAAIRHAASS